MANKSKLLVIGGGFAGVTIASKAVAFADVTLVDPKGYFDITWAVVRGIVDGNMAQRMMADYKDFPSLGRVVAATVTKLSAKEAVLSSGEVVPFDYVAIASGSSYGDTLHAAGPEAVTRQGRLGQLQRVGDSIKVAKHVVLVGGGPSGVETAAEIVCAFAGKQVTLVHGGERLLPALPPKAGAKAKAWLEAHRVKVLLGQRVASEPAGTGPATLVLSGGQQLAADLVLWCGGNGALNTGFMAQELAACLDGRGAIKVLPTLQVVGQPHMFALGDCNDVAETKKGFLAQKQAELAAASLKALVAAAPSGRAPKLGSWKPDMGMPMMVLSLGPADGLCQMGGCVCGGFLPAKIKSADLFVAQTRAAFGLKG